MSNNTNQDKHSEQAFWDKTAHERIYAAFDRSEYADVFEKALGKNLSGKTIADIGCASGISAVMLASQGAKVIGVDISPELIQQAKKLWVEFSGQIDFITGDAEHLDIQDNSVDACFFGGVLHHFPDREKVYEESIRILRSGGKFVTLEPNSLDFLERIEWAVADLRGKLSPNEYPIDPNEMRRELKGTGFHTIQFWTIRHDIPFLAQFPIFKYFFSRQKGFWLKKPILSFINAFRSSEQRGTFFVIEAVKT